MGMLDNLLGLVRVASGGTLLAARPKLNFIAGTVADNPSTGSTDVTLGYGSAAIDVTAADVGLNASQSAADLVLIGGTPVATRNVTFMQVRDGAPVLVWNSSTKTTNIFDANGDYNAVPAGVIAQFVRNGLALSLLWASDQRIPVLSVVGAGGTTVIGSGTSFVLLIDTTTAGQTARLPAPNPDQAGVRITVKDKNLAATHNITVTTAAGLIDGAASVTINTNKQALTFLSDGTNWYVVAKF